MLLCIPKHVSHSESDFILKISNITMVIFLLSPLTLNHITDFILVTYYTVAFYNNHLLCLEFSYVLHLLTQLLAVTILSKATGFVFPVCVLSSYKLGSSNFL